MSIMHDKIQPIIDEQERVCKEVDAEAIVMFAGEGFAGGAVHINKRLHRFTEEAPTIWNNSWKFSQKNFLLYNSRSDNIRPDSVVQCG